MLYDYKKGSKISLDAKPFMLRAFKETYRLQEEAAKSNNERCRKILEQLTQLEKGSWDRPDAVEDLCTAKA